MSAAAETLHTQTSRSLAALRKARTSGDPELTSDDRERLRAYDRDIARAASGSAGAVDPSQSNSSASLAESRGNAPSECRKCAKKRGEDVGAGKLRHNAACIEHHKAAGKTDFQRTSPVSVKEAKAAAKLTEVVQVGLKHLCNCEACRAARAKS